LKLELIKFIPGYRIHFIDVGGNCLISKNYRLYKTDHLINKTFYSIEIPINKTKKFNSSFSLFSRLFRENIWHAVELNLNDIVVFMKKIIWKINRGIYPPNIKKVFLLPRGSRPLSICKDPENNLYWGEYFNNFEQEPVRIYASFDRGSTWEIVYTFKKGKINHIHNIIYDKFRDGFWILTGDRGQENNIFFCDKSFKKLMPILSGEQKARAACIIPLRNGLIIPMDSPTQTSYVQWFDLKNGNLMIVKKIEGSSLYATDLEGQYFFSTCVEPKEPIKYNFKNKKMNQLIYNLNLTETGFRKKVYIYGSINGLEWEKLWVEEKDIFPMPLFQFGSFSFPINENNNSNLLYVNCQSLRKRKNGILIFQIRK